MNIQPRRDFAKPAWKSLRVVAELSTEQYAVQIARDWNTKDAASGYVGYVASFQVPADFLAGYPIRKLEAPKLWSIGYRPRNSKNSIGRSADG